MGVIERSKLKPIDLDSIEATVNVVWERGRALEDKWGIGRLPALVPLDLAQRFAAQRRKYNTACWRYDALEVTRHGQAMLRAYDALEAAALAAGHEPLPPLQWEFETPEGLVILVRDRRDTHRAELHGRQAQVWSIDEIASVLRAWPLLAKAKEVFPGSVVESIKPAKLTDNEMSYPLPF